MVETGSHVIMSSEDGVLREREGPTETGRRRDEARRIRLEASRSGFARTREKWNGARGSEGLGVRKENHVVREVEQTVRVGKAGHTG